MPGLNAIFLLFLWGTIFRRKWSQNSGNMSKHVQKPTRAAWDWDKGSPCSSCISFYLSAPHHYFGYAFQHPARSESLQPTPSKRQFLFKISLVRPWFRCRHAGNPEVDFVYFAHSLVFYSVLKSLKDANCAWTPLIGLNYCLVCRAISTWQRWNARF